MRISKILIIKIFKHIWWLIAFSIIIYILSSNIVTKRTLEYSIDFNNTLTKDIHGFYPEVRTMFLQESNKLEIRSEPLYLKLYTPINFEVLTVKGSLEPFTENITLGLKQKDGSWYYQNIAYEDFSLDYILDEALVKNNKLELILSIPNLNNSTSTIRLHNNWQLILNR